jgi:hypothetical protein
MVTKEMKIKLGLAKSETANEREIAKQGGSPYKRMVKKLPHKAGFVVPPQYEPLPCTMG